MVCIDPCDLMSVFGEDFKAFCIIVWHSIDLTDERIRLMSCLDVFMIKELKVALISNRRCYKAITTSIVWKKK